MKQNDKKKKNYNGRLLWGYVMIKASKVGQIQQRQGLEKNKLELEEAFHLSEKAIKIRMSEGLSFRYTWHWSEARQLLK